MHFFIAIWNTKSYAAVRFRALQTFTEFYQVRDKMPSMDISVIINFQILTNRKTIILAPIAKRPKVDIAIRGPAELCLEYFSAEQ
ncbi:unnamed protein product [Rhizophagus irregularis]|nr:unnamed protein product [Rhizophagus irregularis]